MSLITLDKGSLYIISSAMEKIEKKDPNYATNVKWLRLRAIQDKIYKNLAEKEIEYFKDTIANGAEVATKNKERIKDYERFIQIQGEKEQK